jgi:hypothetical protein
MIINDEEILDHGAISCNFLKVTLYLQFLEVLKRELE